MNEVPLSHKCPYCAEEINFEAKKCKHCNEILDLEMKKSLSSQQATVIVNNHQQSPKWSVGTAVLLSFIIPGAGQMYKGNVISGILWLIFTTIGYIFFLIPGFILHVICIGTAASGDPYKK